MKKLLTLLLVVALLFASLSVFVGCTPREDTLKILNWAEYIDKSLIKDFENYIAETEDGRKIKVSYSTSETNEDMYTKIKSGKRDFDLICPSDYMIEKMIAEDLLLPVDFEQVPNAVDYTSPYITEKLFSQFENISVTGKTAKADLADYTVGYTWGTMGIVYNPDKIKTLTGYNDTQVKNLVSSWNALWAKNPDGTAVAGGLKDGKNNTITFKNSIRDNYFVGNAYVKGNGFNSGNANDTDSATIKLIEDALKDQKKVAKYWEVDKMREEILVPKKNISLGLQWAGDAKYSIDSAKEKDITLKYSVPSEGSNVFFDGWVIPKYAQQAGDLAEKFMNFMCDPENAMQNMEEVGYTSTIATAEFIDNFVDEDEDAVDVSYFLGSSATVMKKVSQVYYPTKATLDKCYIMKDFGDKYTEVSKMWNSIR